MKKQVRLVPAGKTGRTPKPGTKGNGEAKQDKRPRPDPAVTRWAAGARAQFPASRSSTIPMLQSAQAVLGYLPREAVHAIARHVGAAPAVVEGVASFYAQFSFEKPGRHRVTVCGGTACYVRGSGKLMDDLLAELKIAPGATTADGSLTLESVACFGACALAPVVVIDGKVNGRVNAASLRAMVGTAAKPERAARRRKAGA